MRIQPSIAQHIPHAHDGRIIQRFLKCLWPYRARLAVAFCAVVTFTLTQLSIPLVIKEAIDRGATNVDVIVLETEVNYLNNLPSKNAFSLLTNLHGFMMDRIEKQNIAIGKFTASNKNAIINLYYTPTVLTTNSLVFNKHKMTKCLTNW